MTKSLWAHRSNLDTQVGSVWLLRHNRKWYFGEFGLEGVNELGGRSEALLRGKQRFLPWRWVPLPGIVHSVSLSEVESCAVKVRDTAFPVPQALCHFFPEDLSCCHCRPKVCEWMCYSRSQDVWFSLVPTLIKQLSLWHLESCFSSQAVSPLKKKMVGIYVYHSLLLN